jgi:hypothetical protein
MRFASYLILTFLPVASASAQAPQAAALWDLPATTLPGPAALETGAVAAFWNPAAVLGAGHFRIGAQAVQTSDVVGLGGAVFGLSQPLGTGLAVGLVLGRVQVRDLVRTTTSPAADPGEIPVYEQTGGLAVATRIGPAVVGALVRVHDARFDASRDWGLTTDVGIRIHPLHSLTLAAATRFQPIDFNGDTPARYSAGAEYRFFERSLWGAPATIAGRYGFLVRTDGGTDHSFAAGVGLANRLTVDAGYVREASFDSTDWRLVLALGIRAGRYDILAARGSGIRGIGANYRVGLDVNFSR